MSRDQAAGPSIARTLSALVVFGLAFGYVEGAIVTVLRAFYEPMHERLRPDLPPGELFPLITLEELRQEDPGHLRRLQVEVGREAATIIMLAAVPWTFARNIRQWIAGFMIGFGVWDLAYYGTLELCLGWPESLLTWDILFLLPIPWSGPVLAPALVSISIIAAGTIILHREAIDRPIPLKAWHWILIMLGGSIVVISFCWDGQSVAQGSMPGPFPWLVFGFGEALGLATFARACQFSHGPRVAVSG
jgi:hypothetical protein